ncbi:MAG: hypothetical protein K2X86_06385 [Cytophagaceae bacterium]|nr:hypothetical protein [Cytophagaceae bacterium]
MKFVLRDTRFAKLDPSLKREISEKLFGAEKNIAILRLLIVLLNVTVYTFLMNKINSIEWLAYALMIVAFIYSVFVLIFHPYKKYHLLLTSYFTSGTDAFLITLWIIATGGYESSFYVLWYASILGIAMRYTFSVLLPERCRSNIKIDSGTDKSSRIYRGTSGLSKYCISVTYRFNSNVTNCVGPVNSVIELKIGDGYPGCDVCPNRDN